MGWYLPSSATLVVLLLAGCAREPAAPVAATTPTTAPSTPPATAQSTEDVLGAAVRAALGGDWEARYFDAAVDLDGDGTREHVVYAAGPMICGTGGCPVFVFAPTAEGYRVVSRVSVSRPPVRVSPRSTQGWRNLMVGVAGGGIPAGDAELEFDGRGYPENPTVPPAKPAGSLDGAEVLIPEFQSYTEGKTVPDAIRGDPQAPLAGEVLGTAIHTADGEELRYHVLQALTNRYAQEQGIEVTADEKAAYVRQMQATLRNDPNFKDAPTEESAEDRAARDGIAGAFILQWKINRALYQQYGGRIIFQQGGPEPLDAYRQFLEDAQARGDFRIVNSELETAFWRYYRDDSNHSFFPPGSAEERQAFAAPPWNDG